MCLAGFFYIIKLKNSSSEYVKNVDDWIRTADLWYQERAVYQLWHKHCPHPTKNCQVWFLFILFQQYFR